MNTDCDTHDTARPAAHLITFDAWLDASWAANRYRDQYAEDFGDQDSARYASVSCGGDEAAARAAYARAVLAAPRSATVPLGVADSWPDDLSLEAQRYFFDLSDRLSHRLHIETLQRAGLRHWIDDPDGIPPRDGRYTLYREADASVLERAPDEPLRLVELHHPGEGVLQLSGRAMRRGHDEPIEFLPEAPAGRTRPALKERYLLVRAVATIRPGERLEPLAGSGALGPLIAHQPTRLTELDEREGDLYYVSAIKRATNQRALLVGPLDTHLEALNLRSRTRAWVSRHDPFGEIAIGTARISPAAAAAANIPQGKANEDILGEAHSAALRARADAAAHVHSSASAPAH